VSKVQYVIGQRWISESEAELGLGIVLDIANRRLTLSFPAAGERRTYAMDNAPVSRVVYQVGEKVRRHDGVGIHITRVVEQQGCLLYYGLTADKTELAIPEFELDSFVQFSTPRDRLFAGQIDKHTHFSLRYHTLNYTNINNRRCMDWQGRVCSYCRISCISPAKLPHATHRVCCSRMKWVSAKPSKPVWCYINN
jgi:ATP-dependent helicase HepA